uniref:Uncharacterized protein n=1 Tax=Aegilops tauschii TaxID=37682 RepID=M8C9T0_AEGTA
MAAPQPAGFSSSSAQRRGAVDPPPLGPSARSEVCGRGRASPAGPRQRRPTSKGQGPGDGREREDEREKKEGEEGERERGKRRRRRGVGPHRPRPARGGRGGGSGAEPTQLRLRKTEVREAATRLLAGAGARLRKTEGREAATRLLAGQGGRREDMLKNEGGQTHLRILVKVDGDTMFIPFEQTNTSGTMDIDVDYIKVLQDQIEKNCGGDD